LKLKLEPGDISRSVFISRVKLGIISDTHVRTIDEIPVTVRKALADVDLIIHAGDFTDGVVLDGLRAMGKVKAVRGNMDSAELKRVLPERTEFEVNGKKIGLLHGSGAPRGIAERVRKQFAGVDIVIFGHSHEPCNRYVEGVLLFNPGPARNSYGLITIDDVVEANVLKV
jgi:putative phosphoesterase